MEARFEAAFLNAVKKHSSIKKLVKNKVDMIFQNPTAIGEPLKGNWQGFYSCLETPDSTVKFVLLGPHDAAFGID
jgi:mRNA-degrading endonuclease YafQ of YafQ-DinJ toxin-antitoxin module